MVESRVQNRTNSEHSTNPEHSMKNKHTALNLSNMKNKLFLLLLLFFKEQVEELKAEERSKSI